MFSISLNVYKKKRSKGGSLAFRVRQDYCAKCIVRLSTTSRSTSELKRHDSSQEVHLSLRRSDKSGIIAYTVSLQSTGQHDGNKYVIEIRLTFVITPE